MDKEEQDRIFQTFRRCKVEMINKVIVAQYRADWIEPYAQQGKGIPIVLLSNHPRFTNGTRFDYGFLQVALAQGYTIVILPTDRQMSDSELEIYGIAEPTG